METSNGNEQKGGNICQKWSVISGFSIMSPFPYIFVSSVPRGACPGNH